MAALCHTRLSPSSGLCQAGALRVSAHTYVHTRAHTGANMLPPVVVLFMIILLRTIVMDVSPLATSLELWVSPLEVRAKLLCLEAPGSHAVVRPWCRSCHSREQTRPSRSRTVRPSPLLFLASKVFCSFIVCTPTCAKHSPLPPAWFLPQYEHHSRPGHRAGLVREMPPRIAAGQRRSEHCRWLAGTGQSGGCR